MAEREDVIAAINQATVETQTDQAVTGSKTYTVGCITIPLPFLKVKICVDLRISW